MQTAGWLLYMLLQVYIWLLLARMIISWIPMSLRAGVPEVSSLRCSRSSIR